MPRWPGHIVKLNREKARKKLYKDHPDSEDPQLSVLFIWVVKRFLVLVTGLLANGKCTLSWSYTQQMHLSISQFQTFSLFIANPSSPLKIKERNRTDGVRIFLVCRLVGKLKYICKCPFARNMRDELYCTKVRYNPFLKLIWDHIAPAWESSTDPLSSHLMAPWPWIQMGLLHSTAVQSGAKNTAVNSKHCKKLNPFLNGIKTSHQHTRTGSSALKSRCIIFSQTVFHPTFNRKQCMLCCITRLQWEQKC